jgi:hypothetical protein
MRKLHIEYGYSVRVCSVSHTPRFEHEYPAGSEEHLRNVLKVDLGVSPRAVDAYIAEVKEKGTLTVMIP